jgi:hypothetical protein
MARTLVGGVLMDTDDPRAVHQREQIRAEDRNKKIRYWATLVAVLAVVVGGPLAKDYMNPLFGLDDAFIPVSEVKEARLVHDFIYDWPVLGTLERAASYVIDSMCSVCVCA